MDSGDRVIIEAWNTVLYEKFCRFRHLLVEGLSAHSDAALDRCRYPQGARVLDIGCGFGDSTMQIAGQVGSAGEAVGMDYAALLFSGPWTALMVDPMSAYWRLPVRVRG